MVHKKEYKKGQKEGQKLINLYQFEQRYCTVGELAAILGLSKRRIRQLAKIGILKKMSPGHYDLFVSIQSYIRYLKMLLRKYMSTTKYYIRICRQRQTHFENLSFYGDLQPFPEDEFFKMFGKEEYDTGTKSG